MGQARAPARGQRLVAVSYQADDEYLAINHQVLGDEAEVVFLQRRPPQEWPDIVGRAEVLLAFNLQRELPPGLVGLARELRFIQLLSAGADQLGFASVGERIVVAGNAGAYARPIAEHAVAMALALAKRLPQRHAELARGQFDQQTPSLMIDGSLCGILGFGGIGVATGRLMRAFGARIYAVNTSGRTREPVEMAGTLADLDTMLPQLDVVVIALPLTRATRGLIGRRQLGLMKPSAILVNVARGAIVDEGALYEHLRTNPEFGAGIDTWWREPSTAGAFATGYPFFELANLIGSPHNSAIVPGILQHGARAAAANVRRYLRGEPVTGVICRDDYL